MYRSLKKSLKHREAPKRRRRGVVPRLTGKAVRREKQSKIPFATFSARRAGSPISTLRVQDPLRRVPAIEVGTLQELTSQRSTIRIRRDQLGRTSASSSSDDRGRLARIESVPRSVRAREVSLTLTLTRPLLHVRSLFSDGCNVKSLLSTFRKCGHGRLSLASRATLR